MRKRIIVLLFILMSALVVGLVFGQEAPDVPFEKVAEIGKVRPHGIQYDPNFDQFVWTDPRGRLVLVDASTLETRHTLYETGFYNAYEFSHDGKYLALAIDIRIEIWDAVTGEEILTFTPDGALRVEAPIFWSNDDTLLSFNTQVRAPREVRRSENDTTNLPWVWDIASETGERLTILPGARAIPFFDYRNGFIFGENMKAVVGLPERLQVLDITPRGTDVIGEIPAQRFEPDPIIVWSSIRDDMMYVRPDNRSSIVVQINTEAGTQLDLPIGRDLTYGSFEAIDPLVFGRISRIIGEPQAINGNSFTRLLLGSDYDAQFGYRPYTIQLIDILVPETAAAGQTLFLLYIYDETRDIGRLDLLSLTDVNQIVLHPDNNHLMVRRAGGEQRIEVYNLDTGILEHSYLPTFPDSSGSTVLAYTASGETIVSDFQRFDVQTGEILFEDLHYNTGFNDFFWNDDSATIVTRNGQNFWEWDFSTGQIIRREEVDILENLLATSTDGERYLTGTGNSIEIVDIGSEERPRIVFDNLPDVQIQNVYPSPDWENFLITYSVNSFGQHAPSNEVMLYNLVEGVQWHMASDDMPFMNDRRYGWVNNDTVYIYGVEGTSPPERIYGLDYAANGVPQCLIDQFPDNLEQWISLWENFNARMTGEQLNKLSRDVCQLTAQAPDDVTDFLFPTATPTRLPVTATPSVIAGVPLCLTNQFPSEAQDYARIWQEMSEGLTDEETERLELLVCENLSGQSSPQENIAAEEPAFTNQTQVITVDIHTGHRQVSSFIPPIERPFTPNVGQIAENFRLTFGRSPEGKISPNGEYFAVWSTGNFIEIYRMSRSNQEIALRPTNTPDMNPNQVGNVRVVSLRPTATQGFAFLGDIRPTLTPTVTPTSPPRAEATEELSARDVITEMCPYTSTFTLENPASNFAATGRIITTGEVQSRPYVLEPETGDWFMDDTLPLCLSRNNCNMSANGNWIIVTSDSGMFLTHPDFSDAKMLFYPEELALIGNFRWINENLLAYTETLLPDETRHTEEQMTHIIDPDTLESVELRERGRIIINDLQPEIINWQPIENRYAVLRMDFNTGNGTGYRYFIYDAVNEEPIYLARFANVSSNMEFSWHPQGTSLWYRYPNEREWYQFDPDTREQTLFGELVTGNYAPDYRRRLTNYSIPEDEFEERMENGEPIPNLALWDSVTGETKVYCLPGFEGDGIPSQLTWSPDGRYFAFQGVIRADRDYTFAPTRTFLLDTETGSLTEISQEADTIQLWIRDEGGWQ